ncbi:hypothetical protein [Salinisphaera sp. LB1]|uniref:hypothetical protein n=1 Tax=Salinisphaera sp. LB1 TaxID=2183911 RepID=UPI000D7E627F|nr:hypothetical protein [Salinisphaera sp. LB1]AWN16399.1 hypothetical protein SALB1_2201 [Salinisphaera sp. LB1]
MSLSRLTWRVRLPILAIAVAWSLAGCAAGLPTQAFMSPSAAHTHYDGFLAYAAFSDLAVEGAYEKALCRQLLSAGHACDTMLQAAPPTRPQNGDSRHWAALNSGAQAIVVIELADPKAASRRILDNGRIGYRVSLIDVNTQKVMARFAIDDGRSRHLSSRADALAAAVVHALKQRQLLTRR